MYLLVILLFSYYAISICLILSVGQQASDIYVKTMEEFNIKRNLCFDIVSILIVLTILPILTLDSLIKDITRKDG